MLFPAPQISLVHLLLTLNRNDYVDVSDFIGSLIPIVVMMTQGNLDSSGALVA